MARKFSCKYCHKKFTQSKSRKRHIRVQHTKVDYTQARKSFDRRVKTIEGFCKFESQQEIDLNENTASITTPEPEVQIVKELSRDHKGIHLPPMKKLVETAQKEMKKEGEQPTTETAATAAGKGRRQQRIRNRGPYRNSELSVKKEEPHDEPAAAADVEDAIGKGRKEAADRAPTKMLLRERKRPPVEVVEKNKKRTLRRGGTKK